MSMRHKLCGPLLLVAACLWLPAGAQNVAEKPIGEAVERHLPSDGPIEQWVQDPERIATDKSDANAILEGKAHHIDGDLYQYWVTVRPTAPDVCSTLRGMWSPLRARPFTTPTM